MEKLDKFLLSSLAKSGLAGTATSAQICFYATQWGKIKFTPISFAGGTLKLSVASCAASSELQMKEEELIEFVNKKMKKEIVKHIRIYNKS